MAHQIRRLTAQDYDDMVRVWSDAGLPYKPKGRESRASITAEIQYSGAAFFGLFEAGRMIGVAIANWDGRRGWINRLAIDPEYRGQGLAGELIKSCEQYLESHGAQVMAALIEELNFPSMTTFEKEGYECVTPIKLFRKRRSSES